MTKKQKLWKPEEGRFGEALENIPNGGGLCDWDYYDPIMGFCMEDRFGRIWAFTFRNDIDYGFRRVF